MDSRIPPEDNYKQPINSRRSAQDAGYGIFFIISMVFLFLLGTATVAGVGMTLIIILVGILDSAVALELINSFTTIGHIWLVLSCAVFVGSILNPL